MPQENMMDRRAFLRLSAGASVGLIAGPATLMAPGTATADTAAAAFVDDYLSNTTANLTAETNAAVRILSGMWRLWQTGPTWDSGVALVPQILRANVRYCADLTASRTEEEARLAFIIDRRHQSYSAIDGLGPLADIYRAGAKAVTGITAAPDGTPPARISDALPADAPPGSALGAGSPTSELGWVVQLVDTVRGPHASSNPSKLAYQYPRPWRLSEPSTVIDTGAVDEFGFPVYDSDVIVAAQLLRQRATDPADDGGYVSGHANALYLAALALAYTVPERFQELIACASAYSDTRIVAGMHSPVDVVGGRILATALAAAVLHDPRYAQLKTAARQQASEYLQARTGTTADTLYAFAHSATVDTDPYADREANAAAVTPRLTYILPRRGRDAALTVPKGAEVLLETRLPYLDAEQRRAVLRTTALPAGYAVLDGVEQWGRLNLFAAADGYGAFEDDVVVEMDAAKGGFNAADAWRNDIRGPGGLVKRGTGALTLTGDNRYRGGTFLDAGVLGAASPAALGEGDVDVRGGTLRVDPGVRVNGAYTQAAGAALEVTVGGTPLTVDGPATLSRDSVLRLRLDATNPPAGTTVPVLRARRVRGRFGAVTVLADGYRAVLVHTPTAVLVRLLPA
jgi:autotransporter-associated beta strand protein